MKHIFFIVLAAIVFLGSSCNGMYDNVKE
ncbi:hypothetical protein EZS27_023323, partial [termite gut metagenome]